MKTEAARTAQAIKAELKTSFPAIKFSVTSSNFSMGNSVHIDWTDGPTVDAVDAITSKYQYGSFDGMNDIYNYDSKNESIPQAKYVQTQRSISDDIMEEIRIENDLEEGDVWNEFHNAWTATVIYRISRTMDLTNGTGFAKKEMKVVQDMESDKVEYVISAEEVIQEAAKQTDEAGFEITGQTIRIVEAEKEMTFADLEIGSIVSYNDMANVDLCFIVLDRTRFGCVNMMNKENDNIEPMALTTKIDGRRWDIIAQNHHSI